MMIALHYIIGQLIEER